MAKTWVLDTETKGTGAHVAPLSSKPKRRADRALAVVQIPRPPRPADAEEEPSRERSFRLVDVRAASVIGEHLDTRTALSALGRFSSPLDARVYAWDGRRERWRLLSLAETRSLWELGRRDELASATAE
jgi:hypothetical protein